MSVDESWALYRQALDASMDGMALLDADGLYVYVNAAHAAVYGFANREELIGQSWRILYDEEGLNYVDEYVFPVLQDQGRWHGRAFGRRRDGSLFPQELSLAFLPDGGLVCVVRDISDHVKAEELTKMSERIIERSSSVVFRCEPTPRWPILYVSANVTAWGYHPEDLLSGNLSFVDILHADDIQRIQAESARYHATALTRWHQQYRIRTADGTVRYVEDETFVMRNPDSSVQYIEGVLHDVTDRRASEAQIAQLGQLVDESSDEIYVFDSDSLLFVQANRRAQQNLGYSLEELRQMKPVDVAPEMTAERLAEAMAHVQARWCIRPSGGAMARPTLSKPASPSSRLAAGQQSWQLSLTSRNASRPRRNAPASFLPWTRCPRVSSSSMRTSAYSTRIRRSSTSWVRLRGASWGRRSPSFLLPPDLRVSIGVPLP
jgi:PAS domain S-box-containing protein